MYAINECSKGGELMATAQQSNSFLNYHHTYPTHVQTRKLCLPLVTALRNSMAMGQFRWSSCWSYKYRVLDEQSSCLQYGQMTPGVTDTSIIRSLCVNLWQVLASTIHGLEAAPAVDAGIACDLYRFFIFFYQTRFFFSFVWWTLSLACRLGSAPRLARLLRTGALITEVRCFISVFLSNDEINIKSNQPHPITPNPCVTKLPKLLIYSRSLI